MTRVPSLIDMIAQLIAIPSVSSVNPSEDMGNRAVVERLAEWLGALGFATELQPIPGEPAKANLVATLGSGPGGLVLSGHTDTVPFDAGKWRSDPFQLEERDGRLYGLGTSDMKAFLALAVEAARELKAGDLKAPLVILATADEESGMSGARALADLPGRLGRHAVIGEPTGLRPQRLHKGVMMESIRVLGRSGHSSNPAFGVNALDGMARVLDELIRWRSELAEQYRDDAFAVPMPTLNLGHIHGGDNPNRICPEVELQIDIRPLPGMELEALREALRQRLRKTLGDGDWGWELNPLFPGLPPMETPATAPLVGAVEEMTGVPAGAVAFGTEGPFLRDLGMDVVILGPGDIDQAHQPDEFLALDRLAPSVDLLRKLIKKFCIDVQPEEPRP